MLGENKDFVGSLAADKIGSKGREREFLRKDRGREGGWGKEGRKEKVPASYFGDRHEFNLAAD